MNLAKEEKAILKFWKETGSFEKSIKNRAKTRQFIFYEGPPSANARPGLHHVLSRSFKDVICRYKTMRGYRVERKAGWDTHGLPIEVEVEKALGLKNKKEIEKYGVAKFNEKCRQSVWKYKAEWEYLTERIGFWLDIENPYITYDPLYMETLWRIIKYAYEKGLLYEGHRVAPYCPRCGTSISSHEVAQGYEDVTEDSVFIKFEVSKPKTYNLEPKTYLLAWTTTPWTLPGNVALAVNEKIDYVLVKQGEEYYILAKDRLNVLDGDYEIMRELKGKELEGIEYEPVFVIPKYKILNTKYSFHVVPADFVTTEEGTGIVHTAVMYGEDDYVLGEKLGLPKIHTVDKEGKFNELVPKWQGVFVKDAEKEIIKDLDLRGLLYKRQPYQHSYPFCWRCKSPLLYYAMDSWFLKMSALKDSLIKNNDKINWIPAHIKDGRFGEWLLEIKDWNFSRNRYWGTPLPVWECVKCGKAEVIGSRDDLEAQDFSSNTFFIMRHGESEKNNRPNPLISTKWPERVKYHLTKEGRVHVLNSVRELKKKSEIDIIFSSDFTRTKESAEIAARELNAKLFFDKRIREVDLGIYDGRTEWEFKADFPDFEKRFGKSAPKGETYAKLRERMFKFIYSINKRYKNKKILIISHGDPLVVLESTLLGLAIKETAELKDKKYIKVGEVRKVDFKHFSYNKRGELDFHKPFIDEVRFQCTNCKDDSFDSMKRVEELIDVWFDSGAMPFAQNPRFCAQNKKAKIKSKKHEINLDGVDFPADYVCEGIDQTRGWFYTLLAVSTILGQDPPFKNVISLAHVLDKHGKKMSKSKGNTVDPWEIVNKYGADSVRWYFYTVNQPGDYKRFDENDVVKAYRKFILTLYNTLIFYKTYSENFKPLNFRFQPTSYLDEWILSKLNSVIDEVSESMDLYDVTSAARAIESFVLDDFSNWYVRRSRRRFQNPKSEREKKEAVYLLRYVLLELSKLCAPFVPFISEYIYKSLTSQISRKKPGSVHLEDYPLYIKENTNSLIESEMSMAKKVVQIAHELRAREGIRVRQTLSELQISAAIPKEIEDIISEEVNVKAANYSKAPSKEKPWQFREQDGVAVSLNIELTPELKEEGLINEFMRHVQDLRKAAGLKPRNRIRLRYSASDRLGGIISRHYDEIKGLSNTGLIDKSSDRNEVFAAEGEFEWEGEKIWLGIKKVKN